MCSDGHEGLQTTCSESGARSLQDHRMPAASKERRYWHLTAIAKKFSVHGCRCRKTPLTGARRHAQNLLSWEFLRVSEITANVRL